MRSSICAFVWMCLSGQGLAQPSWLPPEVEESAARQLAERVGEIGVGRTDETRLAASRQLVARVRERLESWGEKGVVERAPGLAELDVPASGRPALDAMARYQVCNMLLMIQLQDPRFADDEDAKMTSVTGLTAFTLAVVYLRRPAHEAGDDDPGIEAFLTSAEMETVLERIQSEPEARGRAEGECDAPLSALLEP